MNFMNTSGDLAQLTDTIETQVCLLRQLATDLSDCRTAYAAMDLDAIYMHVESQTSLCGRLREAERARAAAWDAARAAFQVEFPGAANATVSGDLKQWIARVDPVLAERLRRALTEMALAEGQVRHFHRAHSVMLEGSRRTIDMLANALAIFAPMYAAPRQLPAKAEGSQP